MASKSSKRRRKRRRAAQADSAGVSPVVAPGEAEEEAASGAGSVVKAKAEPRRKRRGNVDDEAPPAPWGSFPLVELCVLVGIVMLVLGFIGVGDRGGLLIVIGLGLCSVAGLELAVREHYAGYRSHTLILAGFPAAVVLGVLFYTDPNGLPSIARAAIGLAIGGAGAVYFTRVFRERSGGYAFRFSGLRRR